MEDQKMEIIKQLMEELQDLMHPSGDELGERLGRPKVEVMKMEAGDPEMEGPAEMEPDSDMPMGDPDDDFKKRLMSLRE